VFVQFLKRQVMNDFIPVNEPLLDGNELKYISECISSGWISSEGPFVNRLETEFADYIGKKYAVAVSNGTAAIDIAIEALGITSGDEVIMPSFTIISCLNQILRVGAIPVFIDSDMGNWNMIVNDIEGKITSRTKAIMVVHIYGLPVDLEPVLELCQKYSIDLIEDTAEVIGQTYKGKKCGSFGRISTFSFYPNKHITTGEGGMLLTDDYELYARIKRLRNLGFSENADKRFIHDMLGWNCRLTNIQAAIGVAQLERIELKVEKKRIIGKLYDNFLKNIPHIQLPVQATEYADNIYWVYGILIDPEISDAANVRNLLKKYGIGSRPFFYPLSEQPIMKSYNFPVNKCPNSMKLYQQGLYLPSGLTLSESQVLKICDILSQILLKLK